MKPFNFTFFTLCALACWAARPGHAAGQDGMAAARDPVSGRLRPATAAELRALGAPAMALRPLPGPVTLRADGSRQVHLGDAGLVHAVLRRDGDVVHMECTGDERAGAAHDHGGVRHDR